MITFFIIAISLIFISYELTYGQSVEGGSAEGGSCCEEQQVLEEKKCEEGKAFVNGECRTPNVKCENSGDVVICTNNWEPPITDPDSEKKSDTENTDPDKSPNTSEIEENGGLDVKEGVDLTDMSNKMTEKYDEINDVFNEHAGRDGIITSARDPAPDRSPVTKHEKGEAIDLRTRDLSSSQVEEIVKDLQETLGNDYDVVNEHLKPGAPHIHIEFDP